MTSMFQVDLGERSQDANNVENPYNISVQQLHADVQDAVIECKKTKQKAPTHSRSHRTLHTFMTTWDAFKTKILQWVVRLVVPRHKKAHNKQQRGGEGRIHEYPTPPKSPAQSIRFLLPARMRACGKKEREPKHFTTIEYSNQREIICSVHVYYCCCCVEKVCSRATSTPSPLHYYTTAAGGQH